MAKPTDDVPRWTRPFVATFLAAFLLVALLGVDAWPLTGWRLFSHLRTAHRTSWEADAVDAAGREHPVSFARFPPALRGFSVVAPKVAMLPAQRRLAVCAAWAWAAYSRDPTVRHLRVYRLEWDLSRRAGDRPAPPLTKSAVFSCRPAGAA